MIHSFQEVYASLKHCAPACFALKKLLDPQLRTDDALSHEPAAILSLFWVLRLACIWRKQQENNLSVISSLRSPVITSTEPETNELVFVEHLCRLIGAEMIDLFLLMRSHLEHAYERYCDFDIGPGGEIELRPVETSTTDADGCVLVDMGTMTLMNRTDEKKTDSGVVPSLGADRAEMALKMDCVAHIDLLGRFRTLISICSMCSEGASDTMSEYASLRSASPAADLGKAGLRSERN